MVLSAAHHGSYTFWVTMTAVDIAAVIVFGLLAYRARSAGRGDRTRRYTRAMWGFFAYAGLCFARIMLLRS